MRRLPACFAALALGASAALSQQGDAVQGQSAILRGLDKVNGQTQDLEVPVGSSAEIFGVIVNVMDCRYPADNPTGDAFAYLTVRDPNDATVFFDGWMIASSPALNALDHSRYDIWVMRCTSA
ncbi:DUF2155 domain-containing protein [Phaeobacter italicus]|uniref:DUF2155 domain-containing protein n=1 Tax=Phaeobacter italicus TaxID=481446 RepID=UPI001C9383C4|nr:DUF2155 domain-containing protein [Phaeobacter italicus]MBY6042941.1 DUF2155 domain-containing protein [Phaeobacter italicus]